MELKEKTIERIISNENTVTKLESIYAALREELGGCKTYFLPHNDCRKYGLEMPSLISAVLYAFVKVKDKQLNK